MKQKEQVKLRYFFLLTIVVAIFGVVRISKSIDFTVNCGGYLKRAADSTTIEIAKAELQRSVDYINEKKLDNGYTSVFINTPDEDLNFWANNLRTALVELNTISPNTSALEKSNILIRLKETLTDPGKHGVEVTVPEGISVYPNNQFYFFAFTLPLLVLLIYGLGLIAYCLNPEKIDKIETVL